ncbi:MAG: hypothetical protein HXY34_07900 [Candidatus Thorarchaeota archaeon]|nr:hypothetical protein [Candidatus Thorarchaeota archaeon]
MPSTGFYDVVVEIKSGAYMPWTLVYLAVERSDAKYVPKTMQLVVSFDWNPPSGYLDNFVQGLREFVDHAWDAFEEQLIVTRIDIYVGGLNWDSAHIRCWQANNFNPNALVQYSVDAQGNPIKGSYRGMQRINLPQYWPHDSATWTEWPAYLAITHELGHAFFHLADEYMTGPDVNPPQDTECRLPWEPVSIMDAAYWPFPRTEFCVRAIHDPDGDTAQTWWWWGWSSWRTIAYFNPDMYEPFVVYDTTIDNVAAAFVQVVCH